MNRDPLTHQHSQLVMHIFIQWMAHRNLLNIWLNAVTDPKEGGIYTFRKETSNYNNVYHMPWQLINYPIDWQETKYNPPNTNWAVIHKQWKSYVTHLRAHL